MNMLKDGAHVVRRNGLTFLVGSDHKPKRFRPWIMDSLSFLYDLIMEKSVFPRKLGGDMKKHHDILRRELKDVHGKRVLELATGIGSAVNFLENDNRYVGTDISPGLLKKAAKRFRSVGFEEAEFYVVSAEDLPFDDDTFNLCLCILSLNFFNNQL